MKVRNDIDGTSATGSTHHLLSCLHAQQSAGRQRTHTGHKLPAAPAPTRFPLRHTRVLPRLVYSHVDVETNKSDACARLTRLLRTPIAYFAETPRNFNGGERN